MKFQDVIGQEQITGHLQNAIRMGKVSHAYIIQGEAGSGKKMLADIFATALQCEEGGIEPCGRCQSCKDYVCALRCYPRCTLARNTFFWDFIFHV